MVTAAAQFWISFIAGLLAPLGAVCILPLYPGFLAYLSGQLSGKESRKTIVLLGLITVAGVLLSMFAIGLIFTAFLQASLTKAIGIVSPIAFGILAVISLLLIFNVDFTRILPQTHAPVLKNPYLSSLIFGLFFGVVVLPCNPASLIVLFALSTSITGFLTNMIHFLLFGIGMAFPLFVLTVLSAAASQSVIRFLTTYKRAINVVTGMLMLGISLYYLFFVFRIFG